MMEDLPVAVPSITTNLHQGTASFFPDRAIFQTTGLAQRGDGGVQPAPPADSIARRIITMAAEHTRPFRWHVRDLEGEAIAARLAARQGDTAFARVGNWLLYALGSVFVGEHLWNFFRYFGALDGARSTGAEYGA